MALRHDLVGTSYRYPDHYVVEREKIREYAKAVKADDPASFDESTAADLGYRGLVAPLTFVSIFGYRVVSAFFEYLGVAIADIGIVQVDQKLAFHRPIQDGDWLYCDISLESVRRSHGADIVVTRQVATNQTGEIVQETYTTLAGRASGGVEGFSDGGA